MNSVKIGNRLLSETFLRASKREREKLMAVTNKLLIVRKGSLSF